MGLPLHRRDAPGKVQHLEIQKARDHHGVYHQGRVVRERRHETRNSERSGAPNACPWALHDKWAARTAGLKRNTTMTYSTRTSTSERGF